MKLTKILSPLLLLLLLAAVLGAQVVRVTLDGHTGRVRGNGFAKLTAGDSWRGDIAVQWPELVVLNGAVENYCGPDGLSGPLVVRVDDEVVLFEPDVTIFDACGKVIYLDELTYSPDRRGVRWLDWYTAGGPDVPLEAWDDVEGFAWGGPDPDPKDAGATGSGRVAWLRWPLGTALELQRDAGREATPAQWAEVLRWSAVQWDRAYHYYLAEDGYRRWEAWEDPDAIVGKGYRAGGGFWDTYGRTELHGRTELSGGKYPPDEQHADIAGLVWTSAATGSWAARRSAASLIEARCSFPPISEGSKLWSQSVRELGWNGRCLALYYYLTGEDWCLRYIDRLEQVIEAQSGKHSGRFWAHLQKPSSTPNGYVWLTPAVKGALEEAGASTDLMLQTSGWQSSILGITAALMSDAIRLHQPEGWEQRAKAWTKHELTVAVLVLENLRAPGYDNDTLELITPRVPGEHGFVLAEGYAPRANVVREGSHNYVLGTGLITVGFVEEVARRHPKAAKAAHEFADEWVDYLRAVNYVDGGWTKANLDRLYLTAGRRGWLPKLD